MAIKSTGKVEAAKEELTIYLPDTRGVTISRWGKGNMKLGPDIYTYSRLPGRIMGTCPGATKECQDICYAMRVIDTPDVWDIWTKNSEVEDVPEELPPGAKIVRIHVSGDFSSVHYIQEWQTLVRANPDVDFFAYTRSWRVSELLPALEELRAYSNMQLFASVDFEMHSLPPIGWRRAWLENDPRSMKYAIRDVGPDDEHPEGVFMSGIFGIDQYDSPAYVCPEQTGKKPDCQSCQYCITGKHGDVIFLLH